jgi:phospholipid-binding lipoprotein MlaA
LFAILLVACSPKSGSDDSFDARDPLKELNQSVFQFNLVVDRYLLRPVSRVYHQIPATGRDAISNFFDNLHEPGNVLNSTLQGDPDHAATSFWRFVLNTTFGLGGMRDFAGENGLKEYDVAFDSTLKTYGVDEGSYVVLPLLGPSSVRGTVGYAVDWFTDPVGFYLSTPVAIAQTASDAVIAREENDDIIQQLYYKSLEPYSATRAAYLQHSAFNKIGAPANTLNVIDIAN